MSRLCVLLIAALTATACGTTSTTTTRDLPAYARSAENYREFADAEALGRYLRFDSDTGKLLSAHRGGPSPAYPENALSTFERTLRYSPAFLECDVRLASDGTLVMMHDESLERTSTGSGMVASHTLTELRRLLLKDNYGVVTPFRIPTFDETLTWAEGRTVLMLDIKPGVDSQRLVEEIRKHRASNRVVLIMYSYQQLAEYLAVAPEFVYSVPATTMEDVESLLLSGLAPDQAVGWVGVGEYEHAVVEKLHSLNVKAMLGTYGLLDDRAKEVGAVVYEQLFQSGIDIIASDNMELASSAVTTFAKLGR